MTTRHAQLWGGPMDGASVFIGDGPMPPRVGMHRTVDDKLVPIRGSGQLDLLAVAQHVQVYERVTLPLMHAWRAQVGDVVRLFDASGCTSLEDVPVYVHRELVTRWLAQGTA